ncbi:ABC transporter ATP-binding protein [Microvirga pudoricolor]|uniref:ABC transporter ATP-binding protein n=1 Tax=Microvirga pudoricolor TaxID=2778729 RepID=UPI00195046AA|nr:ABC transporter ATP-binding protein [Microvirga pudoricolor]MBM6595455.1 ABC transporter ATP-binding protein [Microvirga pudoricolor]
MTSMPSGKPVLIRNLRKTYGRVEALADVSLDIAPGEFCTLLGASGSGKTTLLKTLAGFENYDAGSIMVGGRDIGPVPVSKRNIGMVFQNYALFPHMSVRKNIAFGLEMRRMSAADLDRRVKAALELVSLGDYAERLPRELSGGQQQRVALARALVIEPDILLMDEPLGALDKNLRKSIQLQLKDLHRSTGVTIIYVTHDQEEALFLSDKIALMDKGRIVQVGTPRDLYFRPNSRFVASFLGECNFLASGEAEIAIRPERMRVGEPARVSDRQVEAVVENIIFMGTGYRLVLRADGRELTVLTDADIPDMNRGDVITVGYDQAHAMRLAA